MSFTEKTNLEEVSKEYLTKDIYKNKNNLDEWTLSLFWKEFSLMNYEEKKKVISYSIISKKSIHFWEYLKNILSETWVKYNKESRKKVFSLFFQNREFTDSVEDRTDLLHKMVYLKEVEKDLSSLDEIFNIKKDKIIETTISKKEEIKETLLYKKAESYYIQKWEFFVSVQKKNMNLLWFYKWNLDWIVDKDFIESVKIFQKQNKLSDDWIIWQETIIYIQKQVDQIEKSKKQVSIKQENTIYANNLKFDDEILKISWNEFWDNLDLSRPPSFDEKSNFSHINDFDSVNFDSKVEDIKSKNRFLREDSWDKVFSKISNLKNIFTWNPSLELEDENIRWWINPKDIKILSKLYDYKNWIKQSMCSRVAKQTLLWIVDSNKKTEILSWDAKILYRELKNTDLRIRYVEKSKTPEELNKNIEYIKNLVLNNFSSWNWEIYDFYLDTANWHRAIIFVWKDKEVYVLDPYFNNYWWLKAKHEAIKIENYFQNPKIKWLEFGILEEWYKLSNKFYSNLKPIASK